MTNRDHDAVQAARRWIERWPPFPADPDDPDDDGTFGISPLIAYLRHQTLRDMADDRTDDHGDLTRRQMPRSLAFWNLDDELDARSPFPAYQARGSVERWLVG